VEAAANATYHLYVFSEPYEYFKNHSSEAKLTYSLNNPSQAAINLVSASDGLTSTLTVGNVSSGTTFAVKVYGYNPSYPSQGSYGYPLSLTIS
jgi:hypothetical protein